MTYQKQTWTDGASYLNATRLNHIEDGIAARVSDLAREQCLRGVLLDDMTDAAAWTGSVVANADPSEGLRMSTAGADTYSYITSDLTLDARHGFLSFEMRHDANFWRLAWGMSVGVEDFTYRFEETAVSSSDPYVGKWQRVSLPVMLADANTAGGPAPTGVDLEDVRIFRFEIHSNSGGATNVDIRDLRWHPYPYPDNGIAGIVMLFDDGYTSHYTEAFSYMSSLGLVGSVGVIPESVGTAGFASLAQLQEMQAAGWQHCAHGTLGLANGDAATQRTRLRTARNYLTDNGLPEGRGFFVYPGGSYDAITLRETPRVFAAAREVTGLSGETPFVTNLMRVRSYYITKVTPVSTYTADVTKLADRGGLLVMTFHDIVADTTSAPQESVSIADFQTLCDHIVASGVPVFVPSQVFDLTRCYNEA